MQRSRQTAFKVWISDIKNGQYVKEEGEWDPNYVLVVDKKISRINIIANVVLKFENDDKNYTQLVIDDGSSDINVRSWREDTKLVKDISIGDTILIIGRPRRYNNETYLTPEIIKKVSVKWALVRNLELTSLYGKREQKDKTKSYIEDLSSNNKEVIVEEESIDYTPSESVRHKILNLIEKFDEDGGADVSKVIEDSEISENKANKIIEDLLKEGEIFQVKVGKLKLID